ncbi:SPARC-related modular calcium-binding protein 1-like [Siniperca chuatsi]|uniref:SPARC-related modular calcium-binding protein 1-like n=1 Tax=Siniperca chuatsi TaxID=119488 RepID=UPI001CE21153|nr:SPARC-related modular calcium-binding protein 1-like [Siniperca chuatsi]XP_044059365.1 SPARC-related modular calcium-binding protein 1-like [Siniperca chuatsi]
MMLALTFTCRALLVFLLSESVQTDRTAPFLIAENMWPRGCVLDCQRGRHRAVCGSNGRLYKSLCAFQRAQCINTQLRLAPRTHCSDSNQSKCQLARALALEASTHNSGGHVSPASAIFVPDCHLDGHFLPVQCHNQTGYCWCSTPDGKPVSGTSVLHLIPNCTDHITRLAQTTDADSAPIKDEVGEPGPTLDPRKPSELTAPPFWVTILMNGNRSGRRPTDSPRTCERERASLLSQMRSARQEERFIPECTADGRYSPVQCHTATGYCWCVRVESGRPRPGTSARNRIPACTGAEEAPTDRKYRGKPLPGCPGARKKQFLQSLVRALQLEAEHAGSLSPYQASNTPPSSSPFPSFNAPTSATPSSSTLDVASTAALEAAESSRPEVVLRWHFSQLDEDSSGVLSELEARPLRQFLRRRLKPRRCAKKFAQYCDRDGDRGLTLEELRVCLGL